MRTITLALPLALLIGQADATEIAPGTVLHASYVGAAICPSEAVFYVYNVTIQNALVHFRNAKDITVLRIGCAIIPRGSPMTVTASDGQFVEVAAAGLSGYTMTINTAEYAGNAFDGIRGVDQWQPSNTGERLAKDAWKLDNGP